MSYDRTDLFTRMNIMHTTSAAMSPYDTYAVIDERARRINAAVAENIAPRVIPLNQGSLIDLLPSGDLGL